jgi:small subunit ribosomal protein S20
LANIKSQIKRNRQNEKRRLRNRNARGSARTAISQARTALEAGAPETKEVVLKAISELDKAAAKGVIHANNAARRKGRLMKRLSTFTVVEPVAKVEKPAKAAKVVAEPKAKKAPAKKAAEVKPEKKPAVKKTAAKK